MVEQCGKGPTGAIGRADARVPRLSPPHMHMHVHMRMHPLECLGVHLHALLQLLEEHLGKGRRGRAGCGGKA